MKPGVLFLVAPLLSLVACSGSDNSKPQPTPTPDDPKTRPARAELDFQTEFHVYNTETVETLTNARNAVSEFVKSKLPGWSIKAMASQPYDRNVFTIDADLEKQG